MLPCMTAVLVEATAYHRKAYTPEVPVPRTSDGVTVQLHAATFHDLSSPDTPVNSFNAGTQVVFQFFSTGIPRRETDTTKSVKVCHTNDISFSPVLSSNVSLKTDSVNYLKQTISRLLQISRNPHTLRTVIYKFRMTRPIIEPETPVFQPAA